MRVFVKDQALWKPLFASDTSFVDTEAFMREMHRFVLPDGKVNNMYIDFENTRVPVSHVDEIRVVARLASAYQNAVLESALKGEKDVYGNSYTQNEWVQPKLARACKKNVPGAKGHKTKSSGSSTPGIQKHTEEHWDEEMKGDRTVYDASFEMNEDLVPWKTDKEWEEKYGLYI